MARSATGIVERQNELRGMLLLLRVSSLQPMDDGLRYDHLENVDSLSYRHGVDTLVLPDSHLCQLSASNVSVGIFIR